MLTKTGNVSINHGAALFSSSVWLAALEKYAAVTHMTVALYGVDGSQVFAPMGRTPLFDLLEAHDHPLGMLAECARQCLLQRGNPTAIVVSPSNALAVVGTSLWLDGQIVGAAAAGYALVDFLRSPAIEQVARHAGLSFQHLWTVAVQQRPVSRTRLVLYGELLQMLGDTILRENHRTRQYEDTAARLAKEMSVKDEFLAVLSHELRTPLSPILMWSQVLKRGCDPAQQARAIESIERNTRLQIKLVDDLLDLNRVIKEKVPLELTVSELAKAIRASVDTTAELFANKKIDLELINVDEPLMVLADVGRLQQIFGNILSNAAKFTPEGGHVRVRLQRDGDSAVARIVDTGEGIAPQFVPHVFEMFRQQEEGTRRRHSGLGIGLAVVKRLVELHNGTVAVSSNGLGHGTEVIVKLPLSEPLEPHDEITRAASARPALKGLTVLIVEDTPDAREGLQVLLEVNGARVLEAGDGLQALDVLASAHADIVLCDLRMPFMDGFEFLRELRTLHGAESLPVVAVSGLVSRADHKRTTEAGFQGHLDKPVDVAALVEAVLALV